MEERQRFPEMTYVRFLHDGAPVYGRSDGEHVERLEGDLFRGLRGTNHYQPLASLQLLAPVSPGKIVAISSNYHEVLTMLGKEPPVEPLIFFKANTAVVGPDEAIIYPDDSEYVTYEPELAVVIGRECFHVGENEAFDYVFGYTCANDLSARDIQNREIEMARCKSYTTFAPLGPAIKTELMPDRLAIRGLLNGEVNLETTTANMVFGVAEQIAFISRIMRLFPGDVILTGACGVDEVHVGDEVAIEIEQIGVLRNRVITEEEGER